MSMNEFGEPEDLHEAIRPGRPAPAPATEILAITAEEALSPHVDDLLKRQKSLRGEGGVTRGRRAWYYQNWFVFMVVGGLAAFAAWAVIEPYFNDHGYVQGKIQHVDPNGFGPGVLLNVPILGSLQVGSTEILILRGIKVQDHGKLQPIKDLDMFKVDQTIGVYVDSVGVQGGKDIAAGILVVLDPPPLTHELPSLSHQNAQTLAAAFLLFPLVAGFVGLGIGAVDGVICRLPRRALLAGGVGLLVGFVGGFISHILASLIYSPLSQLAMQQQGAELGSLTPFGFTVQMIGRGLAWALAGTAMGLGQGIALRSSRLFLYGLLGGVIGGLLGGLLFDPIDIMLLGMDKPKSTLSRMVGFVVVGGTVGTMIGVVELLARDAWLRMIEGPLSGKEFLIFKDVMKIGASPRSDIYLFNDPLVAGHHANLRMVGDDCDVDSVAADTPIEVNGHPCQRSRLRHGDRITIGRTSFVFEKRGR